jgi:hypothetical protein
MADLAIVAHSLGGLIAAYYLRYGTQDLEQAAETWEGAGQVTTLVWLGVPFHGAMTAFRNMTYGRPVGLNTTLLNYAAVASFPSTFYLLPRGDGDRLLLKNGSVHAGLIADPAQWKRFRWGLLRGADVLSKTVRDRRYAYTSAWLERSRQFHRLLHAPVFEEPGGRRPFVMSVTGRGRPTLATGLLVPDATGRASLWFGDGPLPAAAFETPRLWTDGDGTVTVDAAAPPAAFVQALPMSRIVYEADHGGLMNDPAIQRDVVDWLRRAGREAP